MEVLGDLRERVGFREAIAESSGVKEKSERETIHEFVERLKVGTSTSGMAVNERGRRVAMESVGVQEESMTTEIQQDQWQRVGPGSRSTKDSWRGSRECK